jgi:hypothetical protein
MQRICKQCGRTFQLDCRGGRPREHCYTCQPAGMRIVSTSTPKRPPAWASPPDPDTFNSFRRHVQELGGEGTLPGARVLIAAAKLAEGGHTIAGCIALMDAIRIDMETLEVIAGEPDETAQLLQFMP